MTPGSIEIPDFSAETFTQSSTRPTMIVQTGPICEISSPSASRRLSPRSTASATAIVCATEKDTVALILTPL